jgi:PTS system galactitol-specific IIA component
LSEELVLIDVEAENQIGALKQLGELLYSKGYVKETYPQAVQDREKVYPTGLPTVGVGVAIPHTDTEHVNTPAVAVATLKKPVKFQVMGSPDDAIYVELIFMLAIKNPQMQLQMLQQLTSIFEKEELLLRLKNEKSAQDIISIIKKATEDNLSASA